MFIVKKINRVSINLKIIIPIFVELFIIIISRILCNIFLEIQDFPDTETFPN